MIRARGVLAFLVLVFAIAPTSASAVTYGDFVDAPQIEYPEVVPVWVDGSLCTGTLIEQQIVLTAAHCIYGESGPIQIAVGGSTLNSGRLIDVTATWYHPRYDEAYLQNDIALLHLKEVAGVSRLASLPLQSAKKPKKFTMVGWGRDQNGRLTGGLSAINLDEHNKAAAKAFKSEFNSRTMIGAGRYFADEALFGGGCRGDSGGPLYQGQNGLKRIVMGVTSWGAEGCTQFKPTIYTSVSYYVRDLGAAITRIKARAKQSPLPTGKAGSTRPSTTTPAPTLTPAPLSVSFVTNQEWTFNAGISGTFITNLPSPHRITKACFVVNGKPFPEYGGGDLYFVNRYGSDRPIQSGEPGCYQDVTSNGYLEWSLLRVDRILSYGHAILWDSLGRSIQTPIFVIAGTSRIFGTVYGISRTEFSGTTEISVKTGTTTSNVSIVKVCLLVTMDGRKYNSISSGQNGWNDVGNGCVSNTRGMDPGKYMEYTSSSMITNPAGLQDWTVYATVTTSDGFSLHTSTLAYQS